MEATMKLAEALILRADYQKDIAQLEDRMLLNSVIQEGEKPDEDPKKLMIEFEEVSKNLEDLIIRINKKNSSTIVQSNKTFADLLAHKDVLKIKLKVLNELAKSASGKLDRYSRSEIKTLSTVNVSEIRKKIDDMSKEYRQLDMLIQEHNWKVDIDD
jgi:hypothetical protein